MQDNVDRAFRLILYSRFRNGWRKVGISYRSIPEKREVA